MSQDTKWADPQAHTNNQRNNFCLDSSVQNSTLFLANSSYTNKGISGPLIERMPTWSWILYFRSPSRKASETIINLISEAKSPTLQPWYHLLAWCVHEVRQWRRQFIAAIFRVASCISTVQLTTCRNELRHAMEVAFEKILTGTTLRRLFRWTSSIRITVIHTCVGTLGNA